MGLFLIILLVVFIFWPWISRWVGRWFRSYMTRRAEDMVRRAMGMPSRKEEERAARASNGSDRTQSAHTGSPHRRHASKPGSRYHRPSRTDAAALLKSVAVDVEYTEIKEFDSTTIIDDDGRGNPRVYDEEQVSDVEFMEIRER